METNNEKLEAAIAYAARGWAVLPVHTVVDGKCTCGNANCSSPGKHPAISGGFKSASKVELEIRKWWSRNSRYNIGIATGKVSSLVVLDVDDAKGGAEGLAALEQAAGLARSIVQVRSGGGRHFYFTYPDTVEEIKSVAQIAGYKAVDVRGDRGYIVAPPSTHYTGRTYEWVGHPDVLPPVPEGLLKVMVSTSRASVVPQATNPGTQSMAEIISKLQEGNRNSSFTSVVGSLWTRGIDIQGICALLLPHVKQLDFPEGEFMGIVKSVTTKYAPGNSFQFRTPYRAETENEMEPPEIFSLEEFMAQEYPEQAWLIKPFLIKGGATIMAGMEGQGKTWLSLDMALDLALGRKWLGQFETEKAKVLILDQESNQGFLQKRVKGLLASKGVSAAKLDVTFVFSQELRFLNPVAFSRFEEILEEQKPDMVIVDSFIRSFGDDENSAQKVSYFLGLVKRLIKKHGCSFLFTDHHKKGAPGFSSSQMIRGSSDKAAWADVVLTVWRDPDTGELNVDHSKARYTRKEAAILINLVEGDDELCSIQYKGRRDAVEEANEDEVIGKFLLTALPDGEERQRSQLVDYAKENRIPEKVLDAGLKRFVGKCWLKLDELREVGRRGKAAHSYSWAFGARSNFEGNSIPKVESILGNFTVPLGPEA